MPEGPSILLLKEQLQPFKNKIVKKAGGYGPMPTKWITGKKLTDIKTWGKHLLLIFPNGTVRIHLGLFGDILINERKKVNRSFFLEFADDEINGYVVNAKKIEEPLNETYNWKTDILSEKFDARYVKSLLEKHPDKPIHVLLMNQTIFTGVGNKIRVEALYRSGIHPKSITGKIPKPKVSKLIKEVRAYAKIFFNELKKTGDNKKFGVYQKEYTAQGNEVKMMVLKEDKRKVYVDERRQMLYK